MMATMAWLLTGLPTSTPSAYSLSSVVRVNLTDCGQSHVSLLSNFQWLSILFRIKANILLRVLLSPSGFFPLFKNSLTSSPTAVP